MKNIIKTIKAIQIVISVNFFQPTETGFSVGLTLGKIKFLC